MLNDTPRAVIVPNNARQDFLPTLFGRSHLIVAENAVYAWMGRLSPLDYRGGSWDFYAHQGKPLFLAPRSRTRFRITGDVTCFQGEVTAEAAGIIARMFAFSHLSFQFQSDRLVEGYEHLYAYSADHSEASEIFQAID
jgi:hypothetical protein